MEWLTRKMDFFVALSDYESIRITPKSSGGI